MGVCYLGREERVLACSLARGLALSHNNGTLPLKGRKSSTLSTETVHVSANPGPGRMAGSVHQQGPREQEVLTQAEVTDRPVPLAAQQVTMMAVGRGDKRRLTLFSAQGGPVAGGSGD